MIFALPSDRHRPARLTHTFPPARTPHYLHAYKRVPSLPTGITTNPAFQANTTTMAFKLVSALLLVAAPLSMAQYGGYRAVAAAPALAVAGYNDDAHWGPAEYAFEYAVHDDHTKDIHSHKESRKGDRTDGEYSLVEPDGTIRTVKYYVDGKSGFVAEVIRSGHAVHAPAVIAKPVVAYKPVVAAYKPVVAAYKPVVATYKPIVAAAPVYQAAPAYQHAAPAATSYVQNGYNSQYNRHY
ncbi:cuticle protein 8-like [Cloeon dipterum]|uniref:cuticle protein 8-like n=1 Tax=Cloeon dipterum TaxID=197152 RepID=UPI0032207507